MTDWDAYLDAVAGPIGLAIAPEHRDGVARFLDIAAGMARTLDFVALDDGDLALAPVYSPSASLPTEQPE